MKVQATFLLMGLLSLLSPQLNVAFVVPQRKSALVGGHTGIQARLYAGPERNYALKDGTKVPFYAICFDEEGKLINREDARHLVDAIQKYTDIYFFSHGWNNSPDDARKAYDEWIQGYMDMHAEGEFPVSQPYKPMLVGIIWPSKWNLSWNSPSSYGATRSLRISERETLAGELATDVLTSEEKRTRFRELGMKDDLQETEYNEMFELMSPLLTAGDEVSVNNISRSFLLEVTTGAPTTGAPWDNPVVRGEHFVNPLLLFSFWQMRGRASVVGENGVHALLLSILGAPGMQDEASPPRVHLLGHSFGAHVILSAVAEDMGSEWPRNVDSMLLLQPAVVHKVFEEGGVYRGVLERTKTPIVYTFSNKDGPCRNWFHVALRIYSGKKPKAFRGIIPRRSDTPPDEYAALGGYVPNGLGTDEYSILDPQPVGTPMKFPDKKVCAMKMHDVILSHTDIRNQGVYWLFYSLVKDK